MAIKYLKMPENKVVITVAQTGALVSKKLNPSVPEQPDEIAQSSFDCYNEGAAIVHIHARDKNNVNSGDPEIFKEIHDKIRRKCNVILQDSTGGGANLTVEQRTGCLEARPEMASLNMGTLVRTFGEAAGTVWMNTRADIEGFVNRMNQFGVKPEMEVYNLAMLEEVEILLKKGLMKPPYNVNLILGMAYQGALSTDHTLFSTYLQYLPENCYFNTLGVGKAQTTLGTLGMIMGGNVRVGLEDNVYYKRGELATSNAQLVARIVKIARELGKEPCTPAEAREFFGLKPVAVVNK